MGKTKALREARGTEGLNKEAGAHWRMNPGHTWCLILHNTLVGRVTNKRPEPRSRTPAFSYHSTLVAPDLRLV